jgi:hypothetical protein
MATALGTSGLDYKMSGISQHQQKTIVNHNSRTDNNNMSRRIGKFPYLQYNLLPYLGKFI